MDKDLFQSLLNTPDALCCSIRAQWKPFYNRDDFKSYDPKNHKINYRLPRLVAKPTDKVNPETDEPVYEKVWEEQNKLAFSDQKIIVDTAVAFLTNGDVTLKPAITDDTGAQLATLVQATWDKNKLDYENSDMAETVKTQLECAEIWYGEVAEKDSEGNTTRAEMKVRFYKPSDGYDLIPVWDNNRDLIAFALQYQDAKTAKARYMDVYTDTYIRYYVQNGQGWQERRAAAPLPYGKIPVILWCQPHSDYRDVQSLIDRKEMVMSGYADDNDYTANPFMFIKTDKLVSMPQKGQAGKVLQGDGASDAKFLERHSKPEAIIYEMDTLNDAIYGSTQTPQLDFKSMQGLGDISGAALDRLLISAHMKAMKAHRSWYGKGIQRRINFLVAALSAITPGLASAKDLTIKPIFGLFKLDADSDRVDVATKAYQANIMSQKEAIAYAGIADDPQATLEAIQAESIAKPPADNLNK